MNICSLTHLGCGVGGWEKPIFKIRVFLSQSRMMNAISCHSLEPNGANLQCTVDDSSSLTHSTSEVQFVCEFVDKFDLWVDLG